MNDAVAKTDDKVQEGILEKPSQITLQEYGKALAMVSNNGGDPISLYTNTNWFVTKQADKHRITLKHLHRSSYVANTWFLFLTSQPLSK